MNDIKPGDTSIQGTTLPNQFILLTIDKKDVSSVEDSDSSFVMSDKDGNFKYYLNGRKIVHNQEIEVSSSDPY